MKILIDTSQKDFFLSIIKNKTTILYVHKKNLQKKADFLPIIFKKILLKATIDINDIKAFYITIGPGSFMGARTAFIFSKTICQITKAQLFVIDTLTFISAGIPGEYFLDARSNKSYRGQVFEKETILDIVKFQKNSQINYEDLIKNPQKYLNNFKKINDLLNLNVNYVKNPQIGGSS